MTYWIEGHSILYRGIWNGKPFEDKGNIITIIPEKTLVTTHYSPLSGIPGIEKNYHTVRYDLINQGNATIVTLT